MKITMSLPKKLLYIDVIAIDCVIWKRKMRSLKLGLKLYKVPN